ELTTPIDASMLNDGVNVFNIRYIDENNYYSSTLSKMFYKKDDQIINNKIFGYHYWFDNDFANRIYVSLATPATSVQVLDSINLHQITKGTHTFHFQFHDSVNVWSVVTTDTIQKQPFPIANFSYNDVVNCDSTIVAFNDLSIDGDTYLWSFGNGNYDSTANPTHTYYTSGNYTVALTITDTTTQLDSTFQQTITVIGNTSDSIVETACNSYISPSGNYQYVTSGIYKDTIPNQYSCDSIITINLTVNNVDTSVSSNDPVLTSNANGATYQWVDCNNNYSFITGQTNQTFTATINGSYAVIVTQNGCVDTSACYSITSIGIEENNMAEVKIYPNPTRGLINIDFENISNIQMISIANAVGQEVYHSTSISKKNTVVNLDAQKGLYFITIYYKNGAYNVYKLIKQ
ncbi:MAG: PKD domain-containing protein, partial [Flavobacteriales bacterium]|nr:PKD domain-containing protein [Flavobacteriales bacterium]MCW8914126.1 PKD domain-containing protein [Flavobacteriales bacterium]MCW8938703.1 PKD domain-containing protein [Flavobacteriales bacterium]MCW8991217.1 PKD domain-containing protein [Flavobacteriales bacterium]MCW9021233.1 PKD domain-containing protein [Flavobacteriales bacterium]